MKRVQSAFLKLNCWKTGWVTVSCIEEMLKSKRITSWSDPVVASSSTAQLVIDSIEDRVAKVRLRMDIPVPFL